ncbi:MAG: zinc-ribbon domain-containing protein [Deltaproteobacteria bacterium]|nr:zinc-ribbon domain-containing protein [Deltaproteobacteria bacterium]MBW1927942.1 zinc-ribbon domain-containing protein [Deltaproteobacteria bacterium]MBW2024817.1 zinc-ribbon domain-containing protein [Deltaproteobacteria bacterium]MBW2124715.1 zinc-ribbon domain-containing protein [Deltaproteobacteria bacterium]RLB19037.1 MAG: hypothetical protein DRG63_01545 [Deltaproteobacteria bacterium]
MIVICEECGRKYRVDPAKIKGERAKVRCSACKHVFVVTRSEAVEERSEPSSPPASEPVKSTPEAAQPDTTQESLEGTLKGESLPITIEKKRRMGLRVKMFLLFMVVPIALMIGAAVFYMRQLNNLSTLVTDESSRIASQLAERIIRGKAKSVAAQVQLFLLAHPHLKKEEFNKSESFKKIAVQKVGRTGYTALYELPDKEGVWRTWAHVNPKIIGIDMSLLRKSLGKNFPGFWKVFTGVRGGKESRGYYNWRDKDGKIRAKFMVCTPVTGTRYVVAATTYLDEFTLPVKQLKREAARVTKKVRNLSIIILVGTLILIGLIVSIYGHRITGKIKSLTELAESISVGDLDAEMKITSNDEIGDLADAIGRMQESIRVSIERLRRRR